MQSEAVLAAQYRQVQAGMRGELVDQPPSTFSDAL